MALTPKQQRFVEEYLVDLNATQAALRSGYSPKTSAKIGSENLQKPEVASAISAAQAARSARVKVTQDDVLRDLWAIARADPRELMEYRRTCCRYCWGKAFRYQYTPGEMERAKEAHQALALAQRAAKKPAPPPFDEKGGIGFNAKRDPNPECPECFGDGEGQTFVRDTRTLSPAAARLFAGVKQTKDGLEIKTLAQEDALVTVGKHLGMFRDRVEHSGPDGKPLPTTQLVPVFNITLTDERE